VGTALVFYPAVRTRILIALLREHASGCWDTWEDFVETIPQHRGNGAELLLVYGHAKTTVWASMVARREGHSGSLAASLEISGAGGIHAAYSRAMTMTSSPDTNYGPQPSTPNITDEALLASITAFFPTQSDVSPDNLGSIEVPSSANHDAHAIPVVSSFPRRAQHFDTSPNSSPSTLLPLVQGTSGVQGHAPTEPKRNQTLFIKHIKSCKRSEAERLVAKLSLIGKRLLSPTRRNRTGTRNGGPTSPTLSRGAGRGTGSSQQHSMRSSVGTHGQDTSNHPACRGHVSASTCLHCDVVIPDELPISGPSI
jgi:hypothetical protein